MNKDYLTDCVKDLLMYYEDRDFIQMAFAYDEIQMHKGLKMAAETTFFTEILESNSIVLPKSILKTIEYGGEPILVSVQKKWKHVSFDTMYEGVTLESKGVAAFPDAPTERGTKHINELIKAREEGYDAYILLVIQMKKVSELIPNGKTDPDFEKALERACAAGVGVIAYDCIVSENSIKTDKPIPVKNIE